MNTDRVYARNSTWDRDEEQIRFVRLAVFVREQKIPEELEFDNLDAACRHALALDGDNRPVGTGRLLDDGRIGRVAVLEEWRGRGVGALLMRTLLKSAEDSGFQEVYLHAQVYAARFYEKLGFAAEGPEFEEDGIPHVKMKKEGFGARGLGLEKKTHEKQETAT